MSMSRAEIYLKIRGCAIEADKVSYNFRRLFWQQHNINSKKGGQKKETDLWPLLFLDAEGNEMRETRMDTARRAVGLAQAKLNKDKTRHEYN
jgi:hypothetical protein